MCLFDCPFSSGVVSDQGKGSGSPAKEKREMNTEYFVIVQSKGGTVCIYLYCIYVMKMRWLFV